MDFLRDVISRGNFIEPIEKAHQRILQFLDSDARERLGDADIADALDLVAKMHARLEAEQQRRKAQG